MVKITVLIIGENTFNLIIGKKFALKCEILHIKLVFIDIITNKKLRKLETDILWHTT